MGYEGLLDDVFGCEFLMYNRWISVHTIQQCCMWIKKNKNKNSFTSEEQKMIGP